MSTWFPDYKQFKSKTDEEIKQMLEETDALTPQDRNGKKVFVYKPKGAYTREIVADSEFELLNKVKK
jgi:hypothetical protein